MTAGERHVDVLIIGAGISGIGVAARLRQEMPDLSLAILERREAIGGTWDLFRYPGIRSDSDMFTFGYEFRPWTDLKVLADGESIRDYATATARDYGVEPLIHYGLRVVAADWSSVEQRWTVTAERDSDGEMSTETWTCSFLVTATGYYNYDEGYLPSFPGVETFGGTLIHPQHWPEDLDYAGKRVVVIGSGATAVTLVPAMAGTAAHVTMLQRSPSYVAALPAVDKLSGLQSRFLSERVSYRLTRWRNIWLQRAIYVGARRFPGPARRLLQGGVRKRLGDGVDMLHFTPAYKPWEQRLCAIPDGDLLAALRREDASVVTDTIDSFTPTGIRVGSGEVLEADIVVAATGLNLQVLGGARLSVDGEVRDLNATLTYKNVMLEGLPNLVWIFGYTNASWTLKVDLASAWLVRLLRHLESRGLKVAMPVDRGNNALDHGLVDDLTSGYIQRAKDLMPRQGREFPWRNPMDYRHDRKVLLRGPIDDGILEFQRPVDPLAGSRFGRSAPVA
jgi:monooxygenase